MATNNSKKSKKASKQHNTVKASKKVEKVTDGLTCVQIAQSLLKKYGAELEQMKRIVRKTVKAMGYEIPVGRNGRKFNKADVSKIIHAIDEKYCAV